MAEITITHFKDFNSELESCFNDRASKAAGGVVYHKEPDEVTTEDITLIVTHALPGSRTSATAGTEMKIDLDDEEWPLTEEGMYVPPTIAKQKALDIKRNVGRLLVGGVNNELGAVVNVWVRLFAVTGWWGEGYFDE